MKKFIILSILGMVFNQANAERYEYLSRPTGKYSVAVAQYHLINPNICPDYYYESKDNWFYQNDSRHCHKLNLYIYYPTLDKSGKYLSYFSNDIQQIKLDIKNNVIESTNITYANNYINQESKVTSYVLDSGLIANHQFPLIIFSPGMSINSYYYQNFIANIVSNGYIVASIDSAYNQTIYDQEKSNFLAAANPVFESGISSIWKARSNLDIASLDINYVVNIMRKSNLKSPMLNHVDFNNIGGIGHSLGGRAIYNFSRENNTLFRASVAMEIGRDKTLLQNKSVKIPFLFINAANMSISDKEYFGDYSKFELGVNNYLVRMSPSENNSAYSSHVTFTDYSTLRYNDRLNKLYNLAYNQKFSESDYNQWYGTVDGFNFTNDVNNYLVSFFDYYLKHKSSKMFTTCKPINQNSLLYCGENKGVVIN